LKNFLKNHGIWVLFATAVIAVALAVMSVFSTNASPLTDLAGIIASPFRSAYTSMAIWFNDKQSYYKNVQELEAENELLRKRNAELEAAARQAEKDSEENKLLRERLNLREQKYQLELEAALVTEHAVTNWTSSLTLDRGTIHGVEVNDCVVTSTNDLVGIVSQVGTNWCTVLTIVDTDTSLGAQVFRTKDLGLAQGDFSMMGENRLRLDYLPSGCQLLNGDLVVTSGMGGYYPSDLVIGSIEEVQKSETGAASFAVIAPAADFDSLTEVFIIKDFDIVT
jgi:rod shape-determining protein MreC